MNIDEMNEWEKSVLIFNLIGWKTEAPTIDSHGLPHVYATNLDTGEWLRVCKGNTLYETKNMALAWRVLNWAMSKDDVGFAHNGDGFVAKPLCAASHTFDEFVSQCVDFELPPQQAQAAWLDKILNLAIGTGMVKR